MLILTVDEIEIRSKMEIVNKSKTRIEFVNSNYTGFENNYNPIWKKLFILNVQH